MFCSYNLIVSEWVLHLALTLGDIFYMWYNICKVTHLQLNYHFCFCPLTFMHGNPIGVNNISVMTLAEVAANMSKKHIVTVDQNILYFNVQVQQYQ